MAKHVLLLALLAGLIVPGLASAADCPSFDGSTMGSAPVAKWRTDYAAAASVPPNPRQWEQIPFATQPEAYMQAIIAQASTAFERKGKSLVGTGQENWWISRWLDYTSNGREPLMGLTKERGPDEGDLAKSSPDNYQVWAVGFYNEIGAQVLAQVFANPCDIAIPAHLTFPDGALSVKFLFTDADTDVVEYLDQAPEYDAMIDVRDMPSEVDHRTKGTLRLLQVDIAVKDPDAVTGWVFGTFGWVGPRKGDGLFDNLVPVSLQWGNDPKVYTQSGVVESWINPALQGVMYGWDQRPTLGFLGRANGPADNIRSSCLSCHAAARTPRSPKGILGFGFDMEDSDDLAKVKPHVDLWFQNLMGGDVFDPPPATSSRKAFALDYSLQLEAAVKRLCLACQAGDLSGATPRICLDTRLFEPLQCAPDDPNDPSQADRKLILQSVPPPRQ